MTIRKVPEPVHRHLRVRAAKNGRSLEAELRAILLRLARIDNAKKPPAAAKNEHAAECDGDQTEIALTERDVLTGADAAMKKVRKILREDTAGAVNAA